MAQGARDTTTMASPDHVQAVMHRELRAFRMERTLTNTLRSAQEYRRQLETALDRSDDAIAQVQEGIVVQANASWLKLFGHGEAGALVGQPVMDLFTARNPRASQGRAGRLPAGSLERSPAQVRRRCWRTVPRSHWN